MRLELVAVNTTDHDRELTWDANMTSSQMVSPMSRVMPTPKSIWHEGRSIALTAGETKVIPLATDTALADRSNVAAISARSEQSRSGSSILKNHSARAGGAEYYESENWIYSKDGKASFYYSS